MPGVDLIRGDINNIPPIHAPSKPAACIFYLLPHFQKILTLSLISIQEQFVIIGIRYIILTSANGYQKICLRLTN